MFFLFLVQKLCPKEWDPQDNVREHGLGCSVGHAWWRALHALVSSLSHNSWGWTHVSLLAFCQVQGLDVIVSGWCWWREGYKRRAKSALECWGRRPTALLWAWCPVNRVQGNTGWPDGVGRPSEPTIHTLSSVCGIESLCVGHIASPMSVAVHPE